MSELDELMNLDPLSLTRSSPELEALIKVYRNQRSNAEAGIKPKKESGPKVKIDLDAVMQGLKAKIAPSTTTVEVKRRV